MEFEKLDTRLEMQAVFLPDGSDVDSVLANDDSCPSDCQYDCIVTDTPKCSQ
jgi:hypothetical protein